MKVIVKIYNGSKYSPLSSVIEKREYDVVDYHIAAMPGDEAAEIEAMIDTPDLYGEYLVLKLVGGETATFRNTCVDLFQY